MKPNEKLERELKNNIKSLAKNAEVVIRYSYRSATILNPIIKCDREEMQEIEEMLIEKSGKTDFDNFVVYKLIFKEGGILFIEFADLYVHVGVSITFDVMC